MDTIEQYRKLHRNSAFCRGSAIKSYFEDIKGLIRKHDCKTLLDYGCGKAMHYSQGVIEGGNWDKLWKVDATLYDPGVEKFRKKPEGKFDIVICTDVLEHVEDPEACVKDLVQYPLKVMFVQVSCVPSDMSNPKRRLLDGRPLHISIYPEEWWRELIMRYVEVDIDLRFTH